MQMAAALLNFWEVCWRKLTQLSDELSSSGYVECRYDGWSSNSSFRPWGNFEAKNHIPGWRRGKVETWVSEDYGADTLVPCEASHVKEKWNLHWLSRCYFGIFLLTNKPDLNWYQGRINIKRRDPYPSQFLQPESHLDWGHAHLIFTLNPILG